MHLEQVRLINFRSFEELDIAFSPKVNLIHGLNAQGKTNLLEALYFLSTGRSFRTKELKDLIREGAACFYLEANFQKDGIAQTLKVSFDGKAKNIQHNATTYTQFIHLLGLLPMVLYAPEDVSLIFSGPSERRRFLDLHIAQIDPLYVHHLARYYRAMKHRNHLLKQRTSLAIEPWEEMMTCSAAYIMQQRKTAIADLNGALARPMQALTDGQDTLSIQYQPSLKPGVTFASYRPKELDFGCSLIGPQRDELLIQINEHPAKTFASEGQKRCAIAALKLAEWVRVFRLSEEKPLMSIDDFGVHLDGKRSHFLQDELKNLGQVFLTSPHALETVIAWPETTVYALKDSLISF